MGRVDFIQMTTGGAGTVYPVGKKIAESALFWPASNCPGPFSMCGGCEGVRKCYSISFLQRTPGLASPPKRQPSKGAARRAVQNLGIRKRLAVSHQPLFCPRSSTCNQLLEHSAGCWNRCTGARQQQHGQTCGQALEAPGGTGWRVDARVIADLEGGLPSACWRVAFAAGAFQSISVAFCLLHACDGVTHPK
jgi:hypothetical protein